MPCSSSRAPRPECVTKSLTRLPPLCHCSIHQQEIRADVYFIRITQYTDKMIDVLQHNVTTLWMQDAKKRRSALQPAKKCDIVVHDLRSDDNRFLDVVVESVSTSIKQSMEVY